MALTFEEVEQDRIVSKKDLELLQTITDSIRTFMRNDPAEDRSFLRFELMKFETMFSDCSKLHEKILEVHSELKPSQP